MSAHAATALATVSFTLEPRLRHQRSLEASDIDLVNAVGGGDQRALGTIYNRLAPAVHGTALRILGNAGMAEEVTQAVFLSLWQAPDRFDPSRGTLRALLVSMSHHRAIDLLRSDRSRQRREERHGRPVEATANCDTVGDAVCADDTASAIREALASLDADEREAIELAYFGGRSYREVSRELNVPEGTVKSRIRRGMDRLRAALQPKDER